MYNKPNIVTSSDKGHIATGFYTFANLRTWLRGVIAICCMFMFNFGIVAKESNTYFEERVEVTESLNEMISKVGYAGITTPMAQCSGNRRLWNMSTQWQEQTTWH